MSLCPFGLVFMSLIVFSHGNSFPAGTYRVLLDELRAQGHSVHALDKFGHNPHYPVTSNWPNLVKQLADFTEQATQIHGEPAHLVGHSLGGFVSLMAACRFPHLARGLVLLDSPILGGWKAKALSLLKKSQVIGAVSPGKISRQRRKQWSSAAEAHAHFASKKMFAQWDSRVLDDYIALCTHDEGGKRVLSFDREIETAIYNTLPHNLDRLLKRHPLQCSAAFIGGENSLEMQQVGMTMTRKVAQHRIQIVPGTHLFPMEHPQATAAAIATALLSLPT